MSVTWLGCTEPLTFIKPPQCEGRGSAFHPRHYRQIASPLTRKSFPFPGLISQTLVRSKNLLSHSSFPTSCLRFRQFFISHQAASLFMGQHCKFPFCQWPEPMPEREVRWNTFSLLSRSATFQTSLKYLGCKLHYAKTSPLEAVWLYANLTPHCSVLNFFA